MSTLETPPLLSVPEVALILRVSAVTVRRLIARGELPALRVAGQLRVDRYELQNYIYGPEEQRQ
jgi:excisionase family DNA binding protein